MTSECVRALSVRKRTPAEQVAVRDPGGGDDHLARRELVRLEDLVEVVDPVLLGLLDLVARGRPELRLELAAEAAKRGSREHGLASASDPDGEVVVGAAHGGGDRRGDVAVLDQLDAGAGGPDLLDQVVVARPVEDDRRDVSGPAAVRVGDRRDVLARSTSPGRCGRGRRARPPSCACTSAAGAETSPTRRPRSWTSRRSRRAPRPPGPRAGRPPGRPPGRRSRPCRRWRARRPPRRRRRPRGR